MSKSLTSNAMIAKAQGMFAKRLNAQMYKELSNRKSIGDIASYLKKETYFGDVLEGINEQAIHRGQLEALVRQNPYDKMKRLLRYVDSDQYKFYRIIVSNYEASLILFKIRSLGKSEDNDLHMTYISIDPSLASFNYSDLYQIKDYDSLLNLLKNTRYYDCLLALQTKQDEDLNFTEIEQQLNQTIMNDLRKTIEKDYKGKVKEEILRRLDIQNELIHVTRLYRLKKYFKPTREEIEKLITVKPVILSAETWQKWMELEDADEIYEDLKKSAYRKYMKEEPFFYIEHHVQGIMYRMAQKEIRTCPISEVVYYQYMTFLNIEVENIILVIEGVRYGHDANKIETKIIQ
ncbi:MAG: V-type ATPase subunit [Erysipelotrichaceae bacterium]|nr:V-type ATPase subunit [Erysipelotrichaceae bacterium]